MNVIKIIKESANKLTKVYNASKSMQLGVRVAGIFAVAGLEQKSKGYWESRQRKKDEVRNKTLGEVERLIVEQKLLLKDLKNIKKEKLRQAGKGWLAYVRLFK
ncbi:hypothetical protein H8D85_01425 [bacterium]|nr:hypothetical protein [bacterium]